MQNINNMPADRREPYDVRCVRMCLIHWPFPRGKGLLWRFFQRRFRDRDFLMEVEPEILLPAELDDFMIFWYFVHGFTKDPSFRLSRSMLRSADTILDVGANLGVWTMGAARRVGPHGKAHAFEPVPDNYTRLTRNVALNGLEWVRCEQLALSDRSGHTVFYAATNGNSGLAGLAQRDGVDRRVDVRLKTLDQYCEEQGIQRVDFIKVDVEGAELLVFRGAQSILALPEAPAILFEADENLAASFGSCCSAVKALLHQYGYDIFRFDGKRLSLVTWDPYHRHEDLFALKPYHFERHPILSRLRTVSTVTACWSRD